MAGSAQAGACYLGTAAAGEQPPCCKRYLQLPLGHCGTVTAACRAWVCGRCGWHEAGAAVGVSRMGEHVPFLYDR